MDVSLWSQWVNRADQRAGICACTCMACVYVCAIEYAWVWANVCELDYSRVVQHSGTSAAVTSLSCWERRALSLPGNAWSQPKRSPLISSLLPPPYLLSLPSQSHRGYSVLPGLIGHEKTQVCNDPSTISITENMRGQCMTPLWFRLISFSECQTNILPLPH